GAEAFKAVSAGAAGDVYKPDGRSAAHRLQCGAIDDYGGERADFWAGFGGGIAEPAEFFALAGATHGLYFRGIERKNGLCGRNVAGGAVWGAAAARADDCLSRAGPVWNVLGGGDFRDDAVPPV